VRGPEGRPAPRSHVTYRVTGAVATVSMDHPEDRNALTADLLDGLGDGLAAAMADVAVRVVVLTNTGPAFCAGAGLKGGRTDGRHDLVGVLTAMMDSPKPVVARVAGHCAGGGVGLAAAADISVVAASARIAFSEVRLGVAPAIISVVCLPKMRRGDALRLFLTGERITAEHAAEVGLVTSAVDDAELDGAVTATVDGLLAGGPRALAAAKSLVGRVPGMERREAFTWAAQLSAELFGSEEAAAGIAAFAARTPAPWVQRPADAG